MLPLLLAYEATAGPQSRSVAEIVATLPLALLGPAERAARILLLAGLAAAATWHLLRRSEEDGSHPGILPLVWRIGREGALAALALGPLLLGLLWVFEVDVASLRAGLSRAVAATPLERAAYLAGAAAWEEILFRIGIQVFLGFLAAHLLAFWMPSSALTRTLGGAAAILGASVLFAASHLAVFTQVLGPGGESFDPGIFTWRLLAGILFGALFRWRGPGVAAWAHALFDLALSIGAGPDVFL
jgi:hypothetical protein